MSIETAKKRVQYGAYHGPTYPEAFARNAKNCQDCWDEMVVGGVATFNSLIATQLLIAHSQGRREVVVVDIGSGEAGLFKDYLNNWGTGVSSRRVLAEDPNMRLRLIGLTDSPKPEDHLKAEVITPGNPYNSLSATNQQIEAANVRYTLTAVQSFEAFLQAQGIPGQVDLALATCSLQYLGFRTFESVLTNTISSLRGPGSAALLAVYSDFIPGICINGEGKSWTLNVRGNFSSPSLRTTLREKHLRFDNDQLDLKTEAGNLERALALYLRLGIVKTFELREIEEQVLRYASLGLERLAYRKAGELLSVYESLLLKNRRAEAAKRKEKIAKEIAKKFERIAEVRLSKQPGDGIMITKY